MWLFWLALLIAVAFGCSFLAPSSDLHASALRAFDSSVSTLSRGDIETSMTDGSDAEDKQSVVEAAPAPPARSVRATPRPTLAVKTSQYRKKVSPLMTRMAAVKYDFKCGICGKTLDATWETDHIIPLSRAKSAADFEKINYLDNLQPVHRIPCHQLKSSREAASR